MAAGEHADFWVVIGTIAPIAIAINVVTFAQAVRRKDFLRRSEDETTFTSWLRTKHLLFVVLNLAACLVLIALTLASLWQHSDAAPGWLATTLLLAMLIELFILAVCAEALVERSKRNRQEPAATRLPAT